MACLVYPNLQASKEEPCSSPYGACPMTERHHGRDGHGGFRHGVVYLVR